MTALLMTSDSSRGMIKRGLVEEELIFTYFTTKYIATVSRMRFEHTMCALVNVECAQLFVYLAQRLAPNSQVSALINKWLGRLGGQVPTMMHLKPLIISFVPT